MARILILIGGHLWTSPRSQKEAAAWANLGHDVAIAGIWFDSRGVERDLSIAAGRPWRFFVVADLRANSAKGVLRNRSARLGVRIARELYTSAGWQIPSLHGYGTSAMLRTALKYDADLTIVHSEAGLWVGERLMARGKRVGVDFEDWFSEDLLPEARLGKPLARIRELETRHARDCCYALTTSCALSSAMAVAYSVRPPVAVYNTFSLSDSSNIDGEVKDRQNPEVPSLHWFSQNIGPGRGLEVLFRALADVDVPYECHLRGATSRESRQWIEQQLSESLRRRVFIHDTVSGAELLSRIAEHDIGLALETRQIRSRDLTVTNKLFQYLQAGLAVIGSATTGQREIMSATPEVGSLIGDDDVQGLALALRRLLRDRKLLESQKAAARSAFVDTWCWERQVHSLNAEIARALM